MAAQSAGPSSTSPLRPPRAVSIAPEPGTVGAGQSLSHCGVRLNGQCWWNPPARARWQTRSQRRLDGRDRSGLVSATMDIRVVCISRAIAAGAETIGELVAQRLGFRYVDEQVVTLAARQAQVDPALVAAAEQRQRLLERLLDKLPGAQSIAGAVTL